MGAEIIINLSTFLVFLFGAINLIVLGPIAWILKSAITDLREIEKNHDSLKDDIHLNYLRKAEYNKDAEEIKSLLKDIFTELKNKADK